jgi:aconitate hydratase
LTKFIEINLSELWSHIWYGPHYSGYWRRPISAIAKETAASKRLASEIVQVGLIGSCTNSSYEDIGRAASCGSASSLEKLA